MVYHYTNFIVETNTWWLKRVRPVDEAHPALVGRHSHRLLLPLPPLLLLRQDPGELPGQQDRGWLERAGGDQQAVASDSPVTGATASTTSLPTSARWRSASTKSWAVSLSDAANYKYAEEWSTRYMNDMRPLEQVYREETDEFSL